MNGVASPIKNQAIIHGGKEIEMSLIAVWVAVAVSEHPSLIGQSTAGNVPSILIHRGACRLPDG
jgi:hypothetical protein